MERAKEESGNSFHLLSGSYAGSDGREEDVAVHLPEGAQQEIILKNSGNLFFCLLFVIILTEVAKRRIESTVCQQSNLLDC